MAPELFEKWWDHQGLGARSIGLGPTQEPGSGKLAEKVGGINWDFLKSWGVCSVTNPHGIYMTLTEFVGHGP